MPWYIIAHEFKIDIDVVKSWPFRKFLEHIIFLKLKGREEDKHMKTATGKGVYKHPIQFR